MDSPASYFQAGFVNISLPNLLLIVLMVVVFAIALFAPFPNEGGGSGGEEVDVR